MDVCFLFYYSRDARARFRKPGCFGLDVTSVKRSKENIMYVARFVLLRKKGDIHAHILLVFSYFETISNHNVLSFG